MTTSLLNTNVKIKNAYFYKLYSKPYVISRHYIGTSVAPTSQPKMPDVISDLKKSELSLFTILHKLHKLKRLSRRQYPSERSTVTRYFRKFGSWCSNIQFL